MMADSQPPQPAWPSLFETRSRLDAQPLSANAARAHSDQHQLRSRLVYENNHPAFCMIARNTQLRCFSSANITSLNDISLATLQTKSKLGQQARNHLRRVPCFETSIGVYKFGLRPLNRCGIVQRQFLAAKGAICLPPPI